MRWIPKCITLVFILITCLNWLYVLWVNYQFSMLINSWFVLLPLTGFFYFTFALIAVYGMMRQKQFGLTLAFVVILFGSISDAISYMVVFGQHFLIDMTVVPLILLNLLVVIYLSLNRKYFPDD